MRLAPLLLFACTGSDLDPVVVPPGPKLPIRQTGSGPITRLTARTAELSLPDREGVTVQTEFTLDGFTTDAAAEHCQTVAVPFSVGRATERQLPDGITVTINGRAVPYVPWNHTPDLGWRISRGLLHVTGLPAGEPIEKATITYPNLAKRADRFEPSRSGLEPADFASMRYHVGAVSRQGILLPAPATASWEVTVGEGQRLEASVALATPPGLPRASDGVRAVVRFSDERGVSELSSRTLQPTSWMGRALEDLELRREDPFEEWTVDLSSVAGRTGTLEIAAEASGSPDHDYLFVGHPTLTSPPSGPPRHVVVIGLDTTRPDHMSTYGYVRPTTPELDAFAEHAAVFESAWTPAPRTRPSFRSATTGRYPLTAVGATNIGEVFAANGFATAGIVANVHLSPRFEFDRGFEQWQLSPKSIASEQVDDALTWLEAHRHRDAYLFLHIMDPHLFYKPPGDFASRFVDHPDPTLPPEFNRWSVQRMDRAGELTDQRKAHIQGLYDGEMAYTSAQLRRFLDGLESLGAQTLVVIHSDHGEEFWEHGDFEHNHALYDEVTRAVLMVRPPGGTPGPVRANVPATLADIAPTLYDYLAFDDLPPTDGISLRAYIEGMAEDPMVDRPIGTAHLMYEREQWGVVFRGHKYILRTADGEEELYDLSSDPEESKNLAAETDLAPFREALSKAHLDMPVGLGWRIRFRLDAPATLTLPRSARLAGLFDPEALRQGRANQAWGELPEATPEQVAKVELSEDGLTLTITPTERGLGTAWVMFDEQVPHKGTKLRHQGKAQRLLVRERESRWEGGGQEHITIRSGVVLQTPVGEAERIAAIKAAGEADADDLEMLNALGYIHDGD